ncbi:MAG: hypothetical protein IJL98_04060 [Lachnospiraceae bacterium]|nr:hypothetical protein [Lachnospiraceae bacterium]
MKKKIIMTGLCAAVILATVLVLILIIGKKDHTPGPVDEETAGETAGTYIFDTDWQYYTAVPSAMKRAKVQYTENGCVFVHDGFIYRYERGERILPLCSMANCLHDKETDPEKRMACHAFLDYHTEEGSCLMKYRDDLYVYYERSDRTGDEDAACLVRIALDGSSKTELMRMGEVRYPIIHRGYLYYFKIGYQAEEEAEGIRAQVSFCRMNVASRKLKEETVWLQEGDHGNGSPYAYGKWVWFWLLGNEGTRFTAKVLNTETGEISDSATGIQAYGGKCYKKAESGGDTDEVPLQETDVFGHVKETLPEKLRVTDWLQGDGTYLYVTNTYDHIMDPSRDEICRVYDMDLKQVDEYVLPDTGNTYGAPVGGGAFQYLTYENEENGEWGLLSFDKSLISTLQGRECPYTVIRSDDPGGEDLPFRPEQESSTEKAPEESTEPHPSYTLPETSLDLTSSVEYSGPEDEPVKERLKRKRYQDEVSYAGTYCRTGFTEDLAWAEVMDAPEETEEGENLGTLDDPPEETKPPQRSDVLGKRTVRTVELSAYYTKGKETWVRKITMTAANTSGPDRAEAVLPEDADGFIGVKAVVFIEILEEHWALPSDDDPNFNPDHKPVVSSSTPVISCFDGRVTEGPEP